jgi:hypothetical protein
MLTAWAPLELWSRDLIADEQVAKSGESEPDTQLEEIQARRDCRYVPRQLPLNTSPRPPILQAQSC